MVRLPFFLMVKTEKLMIFGSVRFALFVNCLKTVRFLERYGSRFLTENGNELCTVAFNEKTEHGGLFGAARLAYSTVRFGTLRSG